LRDAALELFGKRGYDGTSVRDIAERAGVTAGLVTHHYGTKENLRKEVDRYVLASVKATWSELLELADSNEIVDHMAIRMQGFQTLFQRRPNIGPYIRRVLMEQSPASNAFFDGLAEVGNSLTDAIRRAGLVRDSDDVEGQSLYALISGLMPVLLSRQIERHLGVSLRSDEGARRWAAIDYEAMTRGVLVDPKDR
jgi:AcrR family transcriptional regulator